MTDIIGDRKSRGSLEEMCDKLSSTSKDSRSQPKLGFYSFMQNRGAIDSGNKKYTKQVYSAGILPFCVKNNTVYLLLGKDNDGKWSDFGGRSEGQDRGRWDTTASREFYEESVGSIMGIQAMLARLQYRKNYIRLKGKTLNGSPYFMYFVRIPFKETYRDNFHSTLEFVQFTRDFDRKYIEKTDIQWISLDTIHTSLDSVNTNTINYPLRKVFKKTFVDNLKEITEYGKNFC